MPFDTVLLVRRLARTNALAFAGTFGMLCGIALALATVILVGRGGAHPGATLGLLRHYFPGYEVSWFGALTGFLWASLAGFALGYPWARIYYRGVLRQIAARRKAVTPGTPLETIVRLDIPHFAADCGLALGTLLMIAPLGLIATHEPGRPLGPHLALLAHYLPGYGVSFAGALIGFGWGTLLGALAFGVVGWLYNGMVCRRHSYEGVWQ